MRSQTVLRYGQVIATALLVLAASGCEPSNRRTAPARAADPSPQVRVSGARILAPDPELSFQEPRQSPAAPAGPAQPAAVAAPEPAAPAPPPDLAPGVKVSLDLVDARAVDAIRALAYQGNVDVVVAAGADNRVTVRLQDTPWMDAFQAVLDGAGLVAQWEGKRARVLTAQQLRLDREAADNVERQRPVTEVMALQNLLATDAAKAVTTALSDVGKIGVDEETNALVVTERPSRMPAIRSAVRRLDRVAPQVMIEAIIIDVNLTDSLGYGVDWTAAKSAGDTVSLVQALTTGAGTDALLAPGGSVAFALAGNNWTLSGLIDALQSQDNVKILANPRVLAINNRPANIEIIDEIPYQQLTQTSNGGQIGTTEFKQVGVKLSVVPRIADDGTVHLILSVEQSAPTTAAVNTVPVINTRRSDTIMTVQDGQTIVLGGLRRYRTASTEDKIPLLGDLWLVGGLFRRVETTDVESELVLFIRTRIVPTNQTLTARERTLSGALDNIEMPPQILGTDPLRLHVREDRQRTHSVP